MSPARMGAPPMNENVTHFKSSSRRSQCELVAERNRPLHHSEQFNGGFPSARYLAPGSLSYCIGVAHLCSEAQRLGSDESWHLILYSSSTALKPNTIPPPTPHRPCRRSKLTGRLYYKALDWATDDRSNGPDRSTTTMLYNTPAMRPAGTHTGRPHTAGVNGTSLPRAITRKYTIHRHFRNSNAWNYGCQQRWRDQSHWRQSVVVTWLTHQTAQLIQHCSYSLIVSAIDHHRPRKPRENIRREGGTASYHGKQRGDWLGSTMRPSTTNLCWRTCIPT